MPRIIRRALYQKLRDLPEMREFQRDFELLSGMKLAFVDELGLPDEVDFGGRPFCEAVQRCEAGRAMCARLHHALLDAAANHPATVVCDGGLREVAVPLVISGIRAGFLVFGGTCGQVPDQGAMQRARHLLKRHGIEADDGELAQRLAESRVVPAAAMAACQRMVHLAARQIALRVTDQLAVPEASMPVVVVRACGFIRSRALVEDIGLGQVARHCAVSEGHLSRVFHHSTGLTFREYVAQVRVEHAKALLQNSGRNVTEAAYESGFQSLSQFHRVFRRAFGMSPGQMRAGRGSGQAAGK